MKVEMFVGKLLVTQGVNRLRIATAPGEDADLLVSLDALETWDPPGEGAEITLEDLQKIAAAVEAACAKAGVQVEFE